MDVFGRTVGLGEEFTSGLPALGRERALKESNEVPTATGSLSPHTAPIGSPPHAPEPSDGAAAIPPAFLRANLVEVRRWHQHEQGCRGSHSYMAGTRVPGRPGQLPCSSPGTLHLCTDQGKSKEGTQRRKGRMSEWWGGSRWHQFPKPRRPGQGLCAAQSQTLLQPQHP